MSDPRSQSSTTESDGLSPFHELINGAADEAEAGAPVAASTGSFTTAFRGYDKDEVDAAMSRLSAQLRSERQHRETLEERRRTAVDEAGAHAEELLAQVEAANDRADAAEKRMKEIAAQLEAAREDDGRVARLETDLAAAQAKAATAEQKVEALTEELMGSEAESSNRHRFDEILQVAEDQASSIIRNATVQADRLLAAAHEDIENRRKQAQADADGIIARAQHDAQQARLRIDTELTAHESQLEREAAHAAEKVSQAEQEAATIRSEAEKGAASLRSLVARETAHARSEAEERVRELEMRALEFEESLTRRQDDAQQEFLVLHNQAVAHAERITQDANAQVAASLEHAQRVSAKADEFDRLMRAQAQQIEADARVRASEHLDRARDKAQHIIDTVTAHSQAVLRDAEDRTRQLRWQQHQLTSFMAEMKELIRPEGARDAAPEPAAEVDVTEEQGEQVAADSSEASAPSGEEGTESEPHRDGEHAEDHAHAEAH
ncbi:cell division protein [Microbacterium awajiense]|uniref:Cell division protein n=1 Tax=Microbacterium awajiense TaxID=415214 RepID=A0ABP7AJ38_9MICO